MKKNAMLKIAAILMVAVLLTTCAISSTFAKYVTKGNEETATTRVAKWGVAIVTDFEGMFAHGDANVATSTVAPGTTKTVAITTNITGTPEVAFRLSTVADLKLEGFGEYCPLVFTVGSTPYSTDNVTPEQGQTKIEALEAAVEAAITELISKDYEAGATFNADADELTANITWAWAFSTSDAGDLADTALGDAAAEAVNPEDNITVTLTVQQTATQLD